MKLAYLASVAIKVSAACLALSACSPRVIERIKTVEVRTPVPVPCPAATDLPAKPDKPALPDDVAAALRTAVAHAARLSGWGDDLRGRLEACATPP
jgi:hypothetical protein